ncbi:MAG: citramalate synthase, partial [bacterium]|nr:citramalate synthase [bacterium]
MKKQKKAISIYDTTLRDGNQAIGIGFSLADKIRIAERLDDLGLDYIEGGWPNPTNTVDMEFYKCIAKMKLKARIAAFGMTKRPDTKAGKDPFLKLLVKTKAPVITIFGKSWDLHVKKVIRCSLKENIDMIADSITYLKKHVDEVIYDAEHFFDGYRMNPSYAMKTLVAAKEAGADVIVLCDTNGGILPLDFMHIFNEVKKEIPVPLGVHMHNDAGCAEANSLIGVDEGAVHIQGTMNGLGERCGNANLCTIIPGLQLKRGHSILKEEQLKKLTETSFFISEIANVSHDVRYPYVGESAFSHKAGAHIDGVRKARESFEHVTPEMVGNSRRFVLSDQAGKGTILEKLNNILPDLNKSDPLVNKLLDEIKKKESKGYHFEAADGTFQLIVQHFMGKTSEPFTVKGFRVIEEKRENGEMFSEATIKVEEKGVLEHTAAEGDGPVNALDNALRKALMKFFPSLKEVKLEDYKVRVLDEREGTAAQVRVLIESSDGKERWGTIGVSTNIIEASWLALIDSLKYKLMKEA